MKSFYGWWNITMNTIEMENFIKEMANGDDKDFIEQTKKINFDEKIIKNECRVKINYNKSDNIYFSIIGKDSTWITLRDFINELSYVFKHIPLKYFPALKDKYPNIEYLDWNNHFCHKYVDIVEFKNINDNTNIMILFLGS